MIISLGICNGPSCTLLLKKTNFEDIRNRISNNTILTQNSSDDINNCFTERKHFHLNKQLFHRTQTFPPE